MVAGHSGQFTSGGYLSTVKHTALAGIEPTTVRLFVRNATSRATETTTDVVFCVDFFCHRAFYAVFMYSDIILSVCLSVCHPVCAQEHCRISSG